MSPLFESLLPTVMLSRIRSLENRAVALATYGQDFVAIRQRSAGGGSLYHFKQLPQPDIPQDPQRRGFLWDYVGHVFGEVVAVYESDSQTAIYLRCPSGASCALVNLWHKQMEVLSSILAKDRLELGGTVDQDSFFDCAWAPSPLDANLAHVLIRTRSVEGLAQKLEEDSSVICEVTFARHQTDLVSREDMERSYRLDLVSYSPEPSPVREPGYVCDVNGHQRCPVCA
ncbi:hypothetical protein B0H16DRAFT_628867 [Mycena metata]|uniref:Uncharacterized protein n=1 Tax=Mycena metata TaxID=1033252 RepID=A0AAD7NZN0_9AGAR|nr:hypothetical protein B0H16DRAFT_628867 [Mycena metata]